jgi:nicotinamidase-related amidase
MKRGRAQSNARRVSCQSGDALIIIDCINDLEFPGGEKVLPWAMRLAPRLRRFRGCAHGAGMPVIYANDNYKHWHGCFDEVYAHCTRAGARGRELSRKLKPSVKDCIVLKPRHSAFFATSLAPLLEELGVRRVILCGIATNLCVLFTAHDAHMQGYPVVVLSDCCAAESDFDHNVALAQLERFCGATICRSDEFEFPSRKRTRRENARGAA